MKIKTFIEKFLEFKSFNKQVTQIETGVHNDFHNLQIRNFRDRQSAILSHGKKT